MNNPTVPSAEVAPTQFGLALARAAGLQVDPEAPVARFASAF